MRNKIGLIYKATSPSGKVYIGQTIRSFEKRKITHIKRALGIHKSDSYNCKFYNAIHKYKPENFRWEILHHNIPQSHLNYLKQFEIIMHNSQDKGYNTTAGADDNPMFYESAKKNNSISQTGKKLLPFTEEHKKKLSNSNKKYWAEHPDKLKERIDKRKNNGWIMSQEQKSQISSTLKLRYQQIKKLGEKINNQIISDEDVIKFRQLYLSDNLNLFILAKQHKVSSSTIKGIANGNQRKDITKFLIEVQQKAKNRRSQKLTLEDVKKMKIMKKNGLSNKEISTIFPISSKSVWRIFAGQRWRNA